jgi:hypothetical protein
MKRHYLQQGDQIKQDVPVATSSTREGNKQAYIILVGNHQRKIKSGEFRCRGEDNIKSNKQTTSKSGHADRIKMPWHTV